MLSHLSTERLGNPVSRSSIIRLLVAGGQSGQHETLLFQAGQGIMIFAGLKLGFWRDSSSPLAILSLIFLGQGFHPALPVFHRLGSGAGPQNPILHMIPYQYEYSCSSAVSAPQYGVSKSKLNGKALTCRLVCCFLFCLSFSLLPSCPAV